MFYHLSSEATAALLLPVPGNGSRRSGGKFLRNCPTHNECKVFFEATVEWFRSWTRQSAVLLSAAGIRAAINFRRRENSAARESLEARLTWAHVHTYTRYHQKSIKSIRHVGTRTRTHARARFALARRLGACDLHRFYYTCNKNKSENESRNSLSFSILNGNEIANSRWAILH